MRPQLPPPIGDLFDRAREAYAADVHLNHSATALEIHRRREIAARDLVRLLGDDVAAVDLVDLDGWILDRTWTWGPACYLLGPLTVAHEVLRGTNAGELFAIAYRGRSIGPTILTSLADVGRVLDNVADRIDAELAETEQLRDEWPQNTVVGYVNPDGSGQGNWSADETGRPDDDDAPAVAVT